MLLPLMSCWRLDAPNLPDRLRPARTQTPFTLPGAQALSAFSQLLGTDEPAHAAPCAADVPECAVPFALPAMLPPDVGEEAVLLCEIDFGALHGTNAFLEIDQLVGHGRVLLDSKRLAVFDSTRAGCSQDVNPSLLVINLTGALRLGRRQTLRIHFDKLRPAGIRGSLFLRITTDAQLTQVSLVPDAKTQTLHLTASVTARRAGRYALRAQAALTDIPMPLWEAPLILRAECTGEVNLSLPLPMPHFAAGTPYVPAAVKVELLRTLREGSPLAGVRCDSSTLLCGYSGEPARFDLPLTAQECTLDPAELLQRLTILSIPAVCLSSPAPDAFYAACTRAGIAVRQIIKGNDALRRRLSRMPCVTFQDAPDPVYNAASLAVLSACNLCDLIAFPRKARAGFSPAQLLLEAAGRDIDPLDSDMRSILFWLRAVYVRLHAEALRQGKLTGALCAPGEWHNQDIADALRTALAPTHLSALPLRGAWFGQSQFSAALHAFVAPQLQQDKPLHAVAQLEDDSGRVLSRLDLPCPKKGGDLGVLYAELPRTACVLSLTCSLMCGETVIEQSILPVYVGMRGMLEAAF